MPILILVEEVILKQNILNLVALMDKIVIKTRGKLKQKSSI